MSFDDELQRSLQGLESDLYAAKMPGAAAARTRAAQRTRNKIVGTVLGGAAAVAAGAVIILQPFIPTANQTPPAITPSPTDESTETTLSEIPNAALMTVDDIQDENLTDWQQTNDYWRPECFPAVGLDGVADVIDSRQVTYAYPVEGVNDDAYYTQNLYLVDPADTEALYELMRDQAVDCVPDSERDANGDPIMPYLQGRGPLTNVGDDAYLIDYMSTSQSSDFGAWLVDYSVVRAGNVVSVVTRAYVGQDEIDGPDLQTPANAADRMCTSMFDESCVSGEPGYEPEVANEPTNEPDPTSGTGDEGDLLELAADPFLTEDQMAVDPYTFTEADANAVNPFDEWCLDDPSSFGVTAQTQYWVTDLDMSGFETVIQFDSQEAATGWLMDYTAIPSRCDALGKGVEDDPSVAGAREITQLDFASLGSGDDALGWTRLADGGPETDISLFGAGVATRGNIGVVIAVGSQGFPDDPGFQDYITQRLEQALDRAIE